MPVCVLYLCCVHVCPSLVPRPSAREAAPAAERVYTHIKEAVLDRRYEGGTLLTEGDLADAVGVSRTPVREALLRLEVEGLIKLYPKKGALVLAVSAQEIADVVETRLLVEEFAVRRAVPASAKLIARLEELLEEQRQMSEAGDLAAVSVKDRCFHAEIVRHAGERDPVPPLRPAARPPAADGRRRHGGPPRQDRRQHHRARRAAGGDQGR